MKIELKNKLQMSTDAYLPIGRRAIHASMCAKLGRLISLQSDDYMKYIIYKAFKRT